MKTKSAPNNWYRYYAVVGSNGLAVMSTWEKAVSITMYMQKERIKAFTNFEDAQAWAVFEFAPQVPFGYYIPTPLKLNQAVFRKDLVSMH